MGETSTTEAPDIEVVEKEFEERWHMFDREADEANRSHYAFMAVHHEYATRDAVRELCDSLGTFTKAILSGFQVSLIITLGRIFDDKSKHTVFTLLQFVEDHPELFSCSALRERNRKAWPVEWASQMDGYTKNVTAPTVDHFRTIRRQLRRHKKMYTSKLDVVRNKWFAHREASVREANEMLGKTNMEDIEAALTFLLALAKALWDLYHGGHELLIDMDSLKSNEVRSRPTDAQAVFVEQKLIRQETREFFLKAAPERPSFT